MAGDFWGSLLSGIISGVSDTGTALINRQSVLDTNAQNERLQREEWGREDTSVQRRMKDLVAAGLNPVLAAGGQGAPTSLTARMEAPEIPMGIASRAISSAQAAKQIAKTQQDKDVSELKEDITKEMYNSGWMQVRWDEEASKAHAAVAEANVADEKLKQERLRSQLLAHDAEIILKSGALSNIGGMGNTVLSAGNMGAEFLKEIADQVIQGMKGKFGIPDVDQLGFRGSRRYQD